MDVLAFYIPLLLKICLLCSCANMSRSSISPPKGSPEDREVWKGWAQRNGLLNQNGTFIPQIISERRRVFRTGIDQQDTALLSRIELDCQ